MLELPLPGPRVASGGEAQAAIADDTAGDQEEGQQQDGKSRSGGAPGDSDSGSSDSDSDTNKSQKLSTDICPSATSTSCTPCASLLLSVPPRASISTRCAQHKLCCARSAPAFEVPFSDGILVSEEKLELRASAIEADTGRNTCRVVSSNFCAAIKSSAAEDFAAVPRTSARG